MITGTEPAFAFYSGDEKCDMPGLTKLEYFIANSKYEPTSTDIQAIADRERMANPHNEPHKPVLHSWEEIRCILIINRAKGLLNMISELNKTEK